MTLSDRALSPTGRARCATSAAGGSGRPTASPRWPPNCASWAPRSRISRGAARHAAVTAAPGGPSTPTTTPGRRCASLPPWAGPYVRINDPKCVNKDLPRILPGPLPASPARCRSRHRRAVRVGQGHRGGRVPRRSFEHPGQRCAVSHRCAGGPREGNSPRTTRRPPSGHCAAAGRHASRATGCCWTAATWATRSAARLRRSVPPGRRAAGRAGGAVLASARLPQYGRAWWARGVTWARVIFRMPGSRSS